MSKPSPQSTYSSFVSKFIRKDALFLICVVIITALIIVIQFSDEGFIQSFRRQLTIAIELIPVLLLILTFQINLRMRSRIKKLEHQLTINEQKLQEIFSGTNNAMLLHDALTGKILEVNNIMCEIFGYSLHEALKLSFGDFSENTPPYDQDHAIDRIRQAVEKGPQLFQWRCKRKDGTLFWAEVHLRHAIIEGQSRVIAAVRDITDHIKARAALKEERDFSDSTIESLPAIFYMYDMEGYLIKYNRNYQIISGFSGEELRKYKMLDLVINEDKPRLQAAAQKVLTDGEAVETGRIITADGHIVSMLYSAKKIIMQNQVYILGMGIDISKQVEAENEMRVLNQKLRASNLEQLASQQQLQASNEQLTANRALLKSIMDSTDDMSWTVDAVEFKLLSFNRGMERHYEGSPYHLSIGISYKEIFNEEYRGIWLRIFQQTLRDGFVSEEYQSLLHNKKIWIRTHLILRDNKPFAISIFARDITEQKRAEMEREKMIKELEAKNIELERFEERFRQIAENIQEVFFLYEKEGHKPLYISPVITTIFGTTPDMIMRNRKLIDRMIHPDDLQRVRFNNPQRFYSQPIDEEFRIKRIDGEIRWVRFRSFLIHDSNDIVVRIAGLATDITGHKNAAEKERLHNEQLQQADKLASLGILVSGVAHEVNNPNNFIMLNTPLLRDAWEQALPILEDHFKTQGDFELGGIPYSEMKAIIPGLFDGIEDGSKRIKKIVEGLKDFARKDTSSYDNIVEVGQVIKESTSLLSSMIRKRTDNLFLQIPDVPIYVKGNKQKLEQVVINLIHNACDALESRKKSISILLQADQSECLIKVIDEGRGISKADLEHIMEPFFTRKRESGGTGLGLSISSGIVKDHHGKLLFESEPGKGTTAIVSLPLADRKENCK